MIFIKSCALDLLVIRTTPGKTVTKEDMEKTVEIILTETETLRFLNLPTVMVSVESEEAEKVRYVWFNCLHCFCNSNADYFVSVLEDSWINAVVYVPSEIIYKTIYVLCEIMYKLFMIYILFLEEEPLNLPYSLKSK